MPAATGDSPEVARRSGIDGGGTEAGNGTVCSGGETGLRLGTGRRTMSVGPRYCGRCAAANDAAHNIASPSLAFRSMDGRSVRIDGSRRGIAEQSRLRHTVGHGARIEVDSDRRHTGTGCGLGPRTSHG
jgi:hypothetical protein